MLPLVNHGEYADGTDRQTDRWQTITLCFALDVASVIIQTPYEQGHLGVVLTGRNTTGPPCSVTVEL